MKTKSILNQNLGGSQTKGFAESHEYVDVLEIAKVKLTALEQKIYEKNLENK